VRVAARRLRLLVPVAGAPRCRRRGSTPAAARCRRGGRRAQHFVAVTGGGGSLRARCSSPAGGGHGRRVVQAPSRELEAAAACACACVTALGPGRGGGPRAGSIGMVGTVRWAGPKRFQFRVSTHLKTGYVFWPLSVSNTDTLLLRRIRVLVESSI
jgi:hypothetical protein